MKRNEAIEIARRAALESVENHNYIPSSKNEAETFNPHEWVIDAITKARDENVKQVNFGANHSILADLERDILAVAEKYSGQIPLASFIGVLEIVKAGYLNDD